MEKFIIEQKEELKKYKLPEENIVACDENSEVRKKNKNYFKGLKEEGIEWPVEIQGSGLSDFNKKEFKVWYPAGDIFLSFAVTVHELGHLRQGEINDRFALKILGAAKFNKKEEEINHCECEQDAWQRGLNRAKDYCPKDLALIEEKFQAYKKKGKFKEFSDFEDFYNQVVRVGLKITEFNDRVEDSDKDDKKLKGRLLGKMIKEDNLTNKFFTNQDSWRAGEKTDQDFAKNFIKKVAHKVAEEEY